MAAAAVARGAAIHRAPRLSVIYFDLETNGCRGINKYSKRHNIVQFAAANADMSKTFMSHVKPMYRILPESSKIHGITDYHVRDAPTFKQVWETFQEQFLMQNDDDKDEDSFYLLVAHNAYGFDRPVLLKELVAHEVYIPEHLAKRVCFGDTLEYFKRLAPIDLRQRIENSNGGFSRYNLGALFRFFNQGQEMANAHDALGDITALQNICSSAEIDWEELFFCQDDTNDAFGTFLGMNFEHGSDWGSIVSHDQAITRIRGIAEKRFHKIQHHLGPHIQTIADFAACFAREEEMEKFLREKVGIHDDALLVEFVATCYQKNPLFAVVHTEFPYAKHVLDRFGGRHLEIDPEFSTIHDLVERVRFNEIEPTSLQKMNAKTLGYYKFIL